MAFGANGRTQSTRLSAGKRYVHLVQHQPHNYGVSYVICDISNVADHQSKILQKLMVDFELNPAELQVLRRGRNSCRKKNRKNPAADQDSTALEAFIGYLYIQGDTGRFELFFKWLDENLENV